MTTPYSVRNAIERSANAKRQFVLDPGSGGTIKVAHQDLNVVRMDTSGARTLQAATSVAVGTVVLAVSTVLPTYTGGGASNVTLVNGVTVNGIIVQPGSGVHFQVVLDSSTPAVNQWEVVGGSATLPLLYNGISYTGTVSITSQELQARKIVTNGTFTMTLPTAAQIVAGFPGLAKGDSIAFYVASLSGTCTVSAGSGGSMFGSNTVATTTSRQFVLTMNAIATPGYDVIAVGA